MESQTVTFIERLAARSSSPSVLETDRIVNLPRVDYSAPRFCKILARSLITDGGTLQLRPIQREALAALADAGGLFGPIGVGHGKTWIALLAGAVLKADIAIILTKAALVPAMLRERERLAGSFELSPIRVLSYSFLSQPHASELLDEIVAPFKKVVIVADEAHCLASKTSARTRRVIRLFRSRPDLHFVAMSGTLLRRSVADCAHLADLALRELSPFPRRKTHLDTWAAVLDVDGRPTASDFARLAPLARFAGRDVYSARGRERVQMFRESFRERLRTSPGVVASDESALGSSLEIVPVTLAVPEKIQKALDKLKTDLAPDDEPIESDVDKWRKAREISAGFYYRWQWPSAPDLEWLEARRDWYRLVRRELLHCAAAGYDSPALVRRKIQEDINAGGRPRAIHYALDLWRQLEDRPEPPSVAQWLDHYLIDDVLAFAQSMPDPVLIWYQSDAIATELAARGLDTFGSGTDLESIKPRTVAASIAVHGTGSNLQQWSRAIVIEPPSSGDAWEQLLGRLHRPGQTADDVVFYVYQHTDAFSGAMRSAVERSGFIEATTGNPQKLLYATKSMEVER